MASNSRHEDGVSPAGWRQNFDERICSVDWYIQKKVKVLDEKFSELDNPIEKGTFKITLQVKH